MSAVPTTTDFDVALAFVLRAEGGYVNNPADPGGATNMGITQRTYDEWRLSQGQGTADVINIGIAEAREIYFERYWPITAGLKWPCNLVAFDAAVNHGPALAQKIIDAGADLGADGMVAVRRYIYARLNKPEFFQGWMNRLAALRRLYR